MSADDGHDGEEGPRLATFTLDAQRFAVLSIPLRHSLPELTPAEREVVELVLEGCSNREIGTRRGTSARTVANQLATIYRKLGVSSRAELVVSLRRR